MAVLTTTSYAILGLLSLRPYTAYELAAQSERSLRFAWPTAPSRLYAEPKRLAAEGLIEIVEEAAGPTRTRQRYRITPSGRAALRAWLRTEPAPPRIEAEVLLRVLFADAGTQEDVLHALERTRAQVLDQYSEGRDIVDAYLDGDVQFPERLHLNLLWMVFIREQMQLLHDWAHFAAEESARWGTPADRGGTARARELLEALAGDGPLFERRTMHRRRPSETTNGP